MKLGNRSPQPVQGFSWMGINAGIKDETLDLGILAAEWPCPAAAVFTLNNLPGAPVIIGGEHVAKGFLQAVVVNSKCANVGLGEEGLENARQMCRWTAEALGITPELVLPSSTGVIGQPLPMQRIRKGVLRTKENLSNNPEAVEAFARAIMTTDTYPKWRNATAGKAKLLGVAKGAGMIEPNMATMLSFLVTDARFETTELQPMLKRVVDSSFNRISIDSDTSTSDTVVLLANGQAGLVDPNKFEHALTELTQDLAKDLIRDGEGSTKLIEVRVIGASSQEMALRIGKSIINSPLIKTAVHGADPNWGRFVMAIGKVFDFPVSLKDLELRFGLDSEKQCINAELLATGSVNLDAIRKILERETVEVEVVVGQGEVSETVWGCDLTHGYIDENAFYTT